MSSSSWWCFLVVALLVSALVVTGTTTEDEVCEQDKNCFLPNCLCGSVTHPGNIPFDEVPQFVVLSFDSAVRDTNIDFYLKFKDFMNPNDCRITMTFFLSHLYANYPMVNELHRIGHEIGLHSVTSSDVENYWRPANESVWMHEMDDLRTIIENNAFIDKKHLKGWRAPYLELGGDEMFSALNELGLEYDCSWPTLRYTNWFGSNPIGALYTPSTTPASRTVSSDDALPRGTTGWVVPMIDLNDNTGEACAMLDNCNGNFNLNYLNNKAPFGIFSHYSWFLEGHLNGTDARETGYTRFLEWLSSKDDVYVVSVDRLLEWMKNPVPLSEVGTLDAFKCSADPRPDCVDPQEYTFSMEDNLPNSLDEVIMGSCTRPQPDYYPWLYNPEGDLNIPAV
ncbi:putative Polysaccharide deacetylase-like 2 [Homarus americanus]|uniref:Putative Polysaccharide deacetylase-like 2 n=1 Tax=Homarus americanus TaxID=6706 RepID=A0A8J5N109_HOMAM|nr:putative Polysaccharide deacetylase-like 2 [Homarus americanus]